MRKRLPHVERCINSSKQLSFLPSFSRMYTENALHTESRSSDEQRGKDDGDLHGEIEQTECDGC
jgi:hypothetical protein